MAVCLGESGRCQSQEWQVSGSRVAGVWVRLADLCRHFVLNMGGNLRLRRIFAQPPHPCQPLAPHRCRGIRPMPLWEQLLYRDVQWFRGGLAFKAHRLLYHSILGLRVIKKRKRKSTDRSRTLAALNARSPWCCCLINQCITKC